MWFPTAVDYALWCMESCNLGYTVYCVASWRAILEKHHLNPFNRRNDSCFLKSCMNCHFIPALYITFHHMFIFTGQLHHNIIQLDHSLTLKCKTLAKMQAGNQSCQNVCTYLMMQACRRQKYPQKTPTYALLSQKAAGWKCHFWQNRCSVGKFLPVPGRTGVRNLLAFTQVLEKLPGVKGLLV